MADNESYNLAYVGLNQREQNLFREEYYSGTDTKIYFDDVEQKEISYINYTIQEQLLPIFGYSSRTFDTVAVGNRVVNGTFVMPIRNPERIATVDDVISGAKNNFDKNEEYNNLETNKLKETDWVDESTVSGKNDETVGDGGNAPSNTTSGNKQNKDGSGHIYDGTAADDAWHEGEKYQKYLDEQKKKEKTTNQSINTGAFTDAEYMELLKNNGYNNVLSFQKNCDWLENNGVLDSKTKEWIIATSLPKVTFANGAILMAGPSEDSKKLQNIAPTGYAGSRAFYIDVAGSKGEWFYVVTEDGTKGYVLAPDIGQG